MNNNLILVKSQFNLKNYYLDFVSSMLSFKIEENLDQLDGILLINLLHKILMFVKDNLKCC
jgi:hypothetical protein